MTLDARVTRGPGNAIGRRMARLLGILIGIALALSLATGGVAHAAERICLPGTETTAEGHSDGDGDQTPHGEKGQAHHHGTCSGHHLAAPSDGQVLRPALIGGLSPDISPVTLGTPIVPPAELRPPIA
ncbi:MAG TPA: hypothetical protein VF481_01165 [Novosphingobium sp.]